MISWIRWKYVVPRLMLLALVTGLLWLCLDFLIRIAIIQAGQAATGARVEVKNVDTNLYGGKMHIQQLAFANPESSMKNWFEAKSLDFDVEMGMVLRRKLVVREGHLQGIQFHTDRTTSGEIKASDDEDQDEESGGAGIGVVAKQLGERGEAWIDDSLNKLETEVENELQSVKLSKELKERWPAEYQRLEQQGKLIERQARQLRDQVELIADDPLKNLDKIQPALAGVEQLRRQSLDVKNRFQQLQKQMQRDRQAIEQAKQHDLQYVRERLRLDELDGNSLSEYLLGPVWSERVEIAMTWIQRSRDVMGERAEEKRRNKSRGTNILFPGIPSTADVLVRKLKLSGSGTVDSKPYSFAGVIFDLSHQPQRHERPATLQIRSQGAIEMLAQGMLDRRSEVPLDRFVVKFPAVRQNGQMLGDPDKLAVELSSGYAQILADIQVEDDQLAGTIRLEQNELTLEPRLPAKYTKHISPENIRAAFAGISRIEAEVTLSGKITRPEYKLKSNLGPQLSAGLRNAVQQELIAKQQQFVDRANAEIDDELNELQQDLVNKHGNLLSKLELGDEQLDTIKKQLTSKLGSPEDLLGRARRLFK